MENFQLDSNALTGTASLKNFAIIQELLCGGKLNIISAIKQASEHIEKLYNNNDIKGLIMLSNQLCEQYNFLPDIVSAIETNAAIRFFYIDALHDVRIISIEQFKDKKTKYLILNLSFKNCCCGLKFTNKSKLMASFVFEDYSAQQELLDLITNENQTYIIRHNVEINDGIITLSLYIDLRTDNNIENRKFVITFKDAIIYEKN